jgi:hypothetical protein
MKRSIVALAALSLLGINVGFDPAACTSIGHTSEGFPRVQCADGRIWYQDMDGQPYQNDAGYPVYPAGTWRLELPYNVAN